MGSWVHLPQVIEWFWLVSSAVGKSALICIFLKQWSYINALIHYWILGSWTNISNPSGITLDANLAFDWLSTIYCWSSGAVGLLHGAPRGLLLGVLDIHRHEAISSVTRTASSVFNLLCHPLCPESCRLTLVTWKALHNTTLDIISRHFLLLLSFALLLFAR